jgi:hypothetical protein
MRTYLAIIFLALGLKSVGQNRPLTDAEVQQNQRTDSLIKQRLIELALKNPAFDASAATLKSAQLELKESKTSTLNQIVISGNVNEFVINGTKINGLSAASYYPKYNIGVNIPLGMFNRQEKNIAREKVKVVEAQNKLNLREIKKTVLIRYEDYKERKELYELQKQITDGQYSNYVQKQKDFQSGEANDMKDLNKEYEMWIQQRASLRSKERDVEVAQLELEEIIGVPLEDAIASAVNNK